MQRLIAAILLLSLPASAAAQTAKGRDFSSLVDIGLDPDSGVQMATSIGAAEIKEKRSYSVGAESALVFWVEARKPDSGPPQVVLAGQRWRWILPREAPKQREFGPSDPSDPVFVGSPWKEVDLRYRRITIECFSDMHWCNQTWYMEVILPDAVVRAMVSNPKKKDLPIALSKRKKVEWRTTREELVAVLDKLGVLAEFSQ